MTKIAIGNDHRGYHLKTAIIPILVKMGCTVFDKGSFNEEPVDYPDYAKLVCGAIPDEADQGILICGSGVGMSIAANKIRGIRAALVHDPYGAKMCRYHNCANVLCLPGALDLDMPKVEGILAMFLYSHQSGQEEDRHVRRVKKINELEDSW